LWCLSYISCSWIDIRKVEVLISIAALKYVFIVSHLYQTYFNFSGFIINLDVSYMTTWLQGLYHIELVGNYSYFFICFLRGYPYPMTRTTCLIGWLGFFLSFLIDFFLNLTFQQPNLLLLLFSWFQPSAWDSLEKYLHNFFFFMKLSWSHELCHKFNKLARVDFFIYLFFFYQFFYFIL